MQLPKLSDEVNVEPKGNVVTSRKANVPLIVLGLLLVVGFAGGVVYARDQGSITVESPSGAAPQGTATAVSTVAAQASDKTTTTKNAPSDELLTALLGTGAVLIVVGLLYGRISTIKLPGGAEISLTDNELKKTAEAAAEKHPEDPKKAALVAQEVQDRLLKEKARGSFELPDAKIAHVAAEVTT